MEIRLWSLALKWAQGPVLDHFKCESVCLYEKYVHNPLRTKSVKTKSKKYKLNLNEDKPF